jgi:tetratricopeptide (TPR) repeat protein
MDCILRATHGWVATVLALWLAAGASAMDGAAVSGPDLNVVTQVPSTLPISDDGAAGPIMGLPAAESAPVTFEPQKVASAVAPAKSSVEPLPRIEDIQRARSEQLEMVAQQADRKTKHGLELAGRGAFFAARSEFLGAMQLIAQGLDAELKTHTHSRAFTAGLTALKESEDFLPNANRLETEVDVSAMIALHKTSLLKEEAKTATALAALQSYLTFAQSQFAKAVGGEIAGSMALHSLGKLHAVMAQKKNTTVVAPESKAVVYYQAALLSFPQNYMAANDLGVLLAQYGRYEDARGILERSLAICPQSTTYHNLAVVWRQMNRPMVANQLESQAAVMRQSESATNQSSALASNGKVQWLDSQTFSQSSMSSLVGPVGATPAPVAAKDSQTKADSSNGVASRTPAFSTPGSAPAGSPVAAQAVRAPVDSGRSSTPASAQRRAWGASTYQR